MEYLKLFAVACLAVIVSMTALPVQAVTYLDEPAVVGNGTNYVLSNTPTANVWYISADYSLAVPVDSGTWAGISLYTASGEAQFFGRGGGSTLSVGTVRGGGANSDWIDLTDDGAEPSDFHLTMEVNNVNQTVKLWLDGTILDAATPDYEGILPGANANNFAQITNITFWAEGGSTVANILISDSLDGHLSPYPVTNLQPASGASNVNPDAVLEWDGPIDPNISSIVSYAIYLDPNETYVTNLDSANVDYFAGSITPTSPSTIYDPTPDMSFNTTYFWRVVATVQYDYRAPGDVNDIVSEVWSFTTKPLDASPVVDAGPKFIMTTAMAATPFALEGTVTDDGVTPVTINWEAFEVALGGGLTTKVNFADAANPNTTVTISEAGSYVVKLTATDEVNPSVSDQKEIVVLDDGCQAIKSTGTWEANYFDLNDDCVVDLSDFAVFALEWLDSTALGQIHESFVQISDPDVTEAIVAEYWLNVAGTDVNDLIADPRFPASPDGAFFITNGFRAPSNSGNNFGRRIYGYLVPPVTGTYTFYIASDDQSRLFLSTDTTPVDTDPSLGNQIAEVPDPAGEGTGWTNVDQWDKYPEQASVGISLTAGQYYYIEALQKEGGSNDHLSVGWIPPGEVNIVVIPSSSLRYTAP
jgi:hypothetical protein